MTPQRPDVGPPKDLPPDWIAGFVDGEGCFHVSFLRHPEMGMGYQVLPEFTVVQHERDGALLQRLRTALGCGVIRRNAGDRLALRVRKIEHLANVIVPFFERHRLRSKKAVDFAKFAKIVRRMARGDHLEPDGFRRIAEIAMTMNRADREALLEIVGGRESPGSVRKAEGS